MKKSLLILPVLFLLVFSNTIAQNRHDMSSNYLSYKGLVMCGYQGWFRAPGDGSGRDWVHFGRNGKFDIEHNTIDFWPDVSEYEKTYETPFLFSDGNTAKVFSSMDESTIDLHFKWMKEYGIDGVFMQRFFRVTRNKDLDKDANIILGNALKASKKYGRAIAVMYDLSGLRAEGEDCSSVIEDWKQLVDDLKVTSQGEDQNYLFHNGKPLVVIWGLGFPDRSYDIRNIGVNQLIDFLKNDPEYGGCSVMLGVPTYFRTLNKDTKPDPYLHELIRSADIVLPWMVGRFTSNLYGDNNRYRDQIIGDIEWCKENGVDYVPIVYPGFSWANLQKNRSDKTKPAEYGAIPRLGGEFFWSLVHNAIMGGAEMLYVAMYDEIDEGTSIMKVMDKPPSGEGYHFVDNDGMPSDHYLWLTGKAGQVLRKEISNTESIPVR